MNVVTITPVPDHKHDNLYCDVCSKHKALERTLFVAACLMYASNATDESGVYKHHNEVYKMAKAAWEALGCPSKEVVDQICHQADGWDGCRNHGFDWWPDAN